MAFRKKNKNRKARRNKKGEEGGDNVWQQDNNNNNNNNAGAGKDDSKNNFWMTEESKKNEVFTKFYVQFVPPEEWDEFIGTLRKELPIVFRVTPGSAFFDTVAKIVDSFFPGGHALKTDEGEVAAPQRLAWFPGGGCWAMPASRKDSRRLPQLAGFKKWLVNASDSGLVVRQEAVSMIPVLLLDVQPHHLVLDTCASPGSKTTQLLEVVTSLEGGGVIANELDENRARMLTHRIQAVKSASVMVSNHDAKHFPRLKVGFEPKTYHGGTVREFDRVLCDVPCSGDGTLRKAVDLWKRWSPNLSRGNHFQQITIAQRGLRLLKVGGRLVYSTCSLHPTEDEAVVLELLRWANGAVRLVDCSDKLPLLKRRPGLFSWKQMNAQGEWIDSSCTQDTYPSMFANEEEARRHNLQWCWRIMPQDQDTGGFFVAVLEKIGYVPDEEREKERYIRDEEKEQQRRAEAAASVIVNNDNNNVAAASLEEEMLTEKKRYEPPVPGPDDEVPVEAAEKKPKTKGPARRSYEPPWIPITPTHPFLERLKFGLDFFGITALDPHKFCIRSEETFSVVTFLGGGLREFIPMDAVGKLRVVHAGLRVFVRVKRRKVEKLEATFQEGGLEFEFRIASEAVPFLAPLVTKRKLEIGLADARVLLTEKIPKRENVSVGLQERLEGMGTGSVIWIVKCHLDGREQTFPFAGWITPGSIQFQIPKEQIEWISKVLLEQCTE